jgi:hypothetical protein
LDTRSAVRWRVPVSELRIVGSGISWTLHQAIRVADDDETAGPGVDDVVDPLTHRSAWGDHLQCLDQPGLLPRLELSELFP